MSEILDDDDAQDEVFEIEDDDSVEDTEDGGAIVRLDETPRKGDSDFYQNLAETLPETTLASLGGNLLDLIDRDRQSREKRDKKYEEGLRRTGLGDDAPGGATFEGASKVVHPLLTEVCVDFASRAMKELWPADGPAKSKIVGDVTKERVAKAQRKADFLNTQLTVQCPEARAEIEQLLTQLPLGGGQYLKVTWKESRNRPYFLFVPIDEMYLPYAASNFYTAQRKTHVQDITALEYAQRVKSGMYRDVDVIAPSMEPDQSRAARANDKIEGRESGAYNEDGLRRVFEVYATLVVEGDDEAEEDVAAPYIVSVDENSRQVLSIYRNWDEEDPSQEELEWIVEFPFVPWRGAYPIGIIHMIGGLSAAATGALRALLDSAHIQNSASMLKLKSGRDRGGQSLTIEPTQVLEVEGGIGVDDIRKLAMPLPFNPPSQTLMQLLGFVVDAGKGVVRTTLDIAESNENVPVGTTLARIEQGQVVFSAIHSRLHNAMQRMLGIVHRLNGMYLDDEVEKRQTGSLIASRADFNGPMDVVPVSDPNIFSEAQRFAQVQAVAQRAQLTAQQGLYDPRKVEEMILKTLKIPNATDLLAPKMTPTEENAISENVKASLGRPIVAFPAQDHIAHLKAHLDFLKSPALGSSQLMAPIFMPIIVPHLREHVALWYAAEVFETASDVMDGEDFGRLIQATKDKDDKKALDRMVAEASVSVVAQASQVFANLPPVVAQAIQIIQQTTPQTPADPAVQVAREDVQMRAKANADKVALEQAKLAAKAQEGQQQAQVDARELQVAEAAEMERERLRQEAETRRAAMAEAGDTARNHEDNVTALQLAALGGGSQDPNPDPRP